MTCKKSTYFNTSLTIRSTFIRVRYSVQKESSTQKCQKMNSYPHSNDQISKKDVESILINYGYVNNNINVDYVVKNASDMMLGFLADYFKLKVVVGEEGERKVLNFFIKTVSQTNIAKATVTKELNLFEKEIAFYTDIKKCLEIPGIKPWSARLVTTLGDAMVFQDLNALQYTLRNKMDKFDMNHTLQAISTLARFHASSITYEENRSKELHRQYRIINEYEQYLDEASYKISDPWYLQCMNSSLEAIKTFSKYRLEENVMIEVEKRWRNIWVSALDLAKCSSEHRNVICHRDLWNNNLLFHYKKIKEDSYEPDDCMLVDFQAIRYQPPAGDMMMMLHCNLEPKFRESNMDKFLEYYYQELKGNLSKNGISIENIMSKENFLNSSSQQRLWGLIAWACLVPQTGMNDEETTNIFCDTERFIDILTKNKGSFMKKRMETNLGYKKMVMEIFDEIIQRYCLTR